MPVDDHARFRSIVWEYYRQYRRDLPWRQSIHGVYDPYRILISEVMLQQTQVPRVIPKYQQFLTKFPDFRSLAAAPLSEVLTAWSGLGYNRRTKYLSNTARQVVSSYDGHLPDTQTTLQTLPGIGENTAGAILAYAFNRPVVFIETNIRTVYIYHFFSGVGRVNDRDIKQQIAITLDSRRPREWYWALMDYGTFLKAAAGNLSRASDSFAKQLAFEGSRRQLRGKVIQLLIKGPLTLPMLRSQAPDDRLQSVLDNLVREGMIRRRGDEYSLQ